MTRSPGAVEVRSADFAMVSWGTSTKTAVLHRVSLVPGAQLLPGLAQFKQSKVG